MREIKFRAIDVASNIMVYGYYVQMDYPNTKHFICFSKQGLLDYYNILPTTLGQYTGLKDKNGKEIYDKSYIRFDDDDPKYKENIFIVIYENGGFYCYSTKYKDYKGDPLLSGTLKEVIDTANQYFNGIVEVGNKYDNPELLGYK